MTYEEFEFLDLLKTKMPAGSIFLHASEVDLSQKNVGMVFFDKDSSVSINFYRAAWNILVPNGILCVRTNKWAVSAIKEIRDIAIEADIEIILPPCPDIFYIVNPYDI